MTDCLVATGRSLSPPRWAVPEATPESGEEFQRLVKEGVEAIGRETMESIKNRIREGIIQQEIEGLG